MIIIHSFSLSYKYIVHDTSKYVLHFRYFVVFTSIFILLYEMSMKWNVFLYAYLKRELYFEFSHIFFSRHRSRWKNNKNMFIMMMMIVSE